MNDSLPESEGPACAEIFADWAANLTADEIPEAVRRAAQAALLDIAGLTVAARNTDYIAALLEGWDGEGNCTAFGHGRALDAAGAAVVNGTAAHGEDFDDTFEGTPIHTGAVMIPAVLAACERHGRSGADALCGIVAGTELMCRMALVAPTAIHRAGFHPTAVIGAMGAAAGVGAATGMNARQITDALGVAGSMASGIIEYLAEGTWPKRLHPGWAAQNGVRAAELGRHGFLGPRTVFEGTHGFFFAFADHGIPPDYSHLTDALGETWRTETIAFKPYACGTMTQPFIDCAISLARDGVVPEQVRKITCNVGEGTVHRLWEPLAEKRKPTTPYSAKFSVPFCIAVALTDRAAGIGQFTEERISDPEVLRLASVIGYEIDPADEYPRNYSGHIRATLTDGTVVEARQPHLRGGVREPLGHDELAAKFRANVAFGGWNEAEATALADYCAALFDAPDVSGLEAFRG